MSNPYKEGWVAGDTVTAGTPDMRAEHLIKSDDAIYVGKGAKKQNRDPTDPSFITPLQ